MKTYLYNIIIISLFLCGCSKTNNNVEYNKSCLFIENYDYTNSVPYNEKIDDSYFNDVFIGGDSRVGSLALYNKLSNADIKYIESLSLNMINITKVNNDDPDSVTLYDLIMNSEKENIYIMLGLNELGFNSYEKWSNSYEEFIKEVKEAHPNSYIYLVLMYTPSNAYSVKKEIIQDKINNMNSLLIDIATRNYVYYLNPNEYLLGEDGYIKDEYSFDGIHFTSLGTDVFIEYLKEHVGGKMYVKEVCE